MQKVSAQRRICITPENIRCYGLGQIVFMSSHLPLTQNVNIVVSSLVSHGTVSQIPMQRSLDCAKSFSSSSYVWNAEMGCSDGPIGILLN